MYTQHHIIVDDFYENPMAVRNMALSMPHEDSNWGNYAGVMSQSEWFTPEHIDIFRTLTNEPVQRPTSGLNGRFRFTMAKDTMSQYIHFDPGPGQVWAGLVHLSLPEHLDKHEPEINCGTAFWQHKRTGLECIPIDPSVQQQHGWHSTEDLKDFLDTEGNDESLWTKTLYVPAKFNRLILFRPWQFHSPGQAFGDSFEYCRLVQLFFLRLPDPNRT